MSEHGSRTRGNFRQKTARAPFLSRIFCLGKFCSCTRAECLSAVHTSARIRVIRPMVLPFTRPGVHSYFLFLLIRSSSAIFWNRSYGDRIKPSAPQLFVFFFLLAFSFFPFCSLFSAIFSSQKLVGGLQLSSAPCLSMRCSLDYHASDWFTFAEIIRKPRGATSEIPRTPMTCDCGISLAEPSAFISSYSVRERPLQGYLGSVGHG